MADEHRSLAQRVLDLAVFAPAGLLLTVAEDFPALAEKGRTQMEGQVRNARVVGQLVVTMGQRQLQRRFGRAAEEEPVTAVVPAPSTSPVPTEPTLVPMERLEPEPVPEPTTTTTLAIPDYDTLSASQVVRRLDGLAPSELDAIARHEATTRGRRTILHRVQQLRGEQSSAS